jgi:hypothetical protein
MIKTNESRFFDTIMHNMMQQSGSDAAEPTGI